MHLKCIHELCIIILIFQSYLHHKRVISLFYIDFGDNSQFPHLFGINPALAENPIFYILMFQGPKRRPNELKIYGDHYFGRRKTQERKKSTNGGQRAKIGGPTQPGTVAAWGPLFCPSGLRSFTSFAPRSSSFQNNDPRKFIAHLDVVWVPETQKYRKQGFLPVEG